MMNNTRRVFVCLLGLVVILSILVFPVSAQGNDSGAVNNTENTTVNYENTSSYPPQQNGYDLFLESQRNLDRSLSVLNTVATSIQTLIEIFALVIAIVGGLGLLEIKKWHQTRKNIEKDAEAISELKTKLEKYLDEARNKVENISQIISTEKPSDEVLKKLDDFSRHVETLELLGATLKPKDYINRGTDLFYKNDYESALKAYDKAIELEPHNDIAWSNKSGTLINLSKYDEAFEASNKAIELKLNNVIAWHNKGGALSGLGQHVEAIKAYEKIIELKPDNFEAWSSKGFNLSELCQYNEAIEAFEKSIELKQDYDEAWFNRACVYSLMGNKEKALSDLEKAIELDTSNKERAKKDEDFKDLWDDEKFKKLVK